MDAIPIDTHAADLAALIDDLEQGLPRFPLSKAVNRIDDWRRAVLATERPELQPIADHLGRLHEALVGEHPDVAVIGSLLVTLGEQTQAVAPGADARLQNGLQRLGSLLRHAGHALSGNSAAE